MADYIDRAAIKWHDEEFEERCHNDRWTEVATIAFKKEVDKIPAADVRPVVHRRWIRYGAEKWYCSGCGLTIETEEECLPNFCKDCGADMREESYD